MIRAIALDDEPPALRLLTHFCSLTDTIELVETFTRTDDALAYLRAHPVDLLFLDINMPAMSGIDFHQAARQQEGLSQLMVIFTTAYAEYAVEGFNLNAVDYLLKPFTRDRFLQAVQKAVDYHELIHRAASPKTAYLYIRADYRMHKIPLDEILFIEGLDDYLKVHLQGSRPIVARMTMKAMTQKLEETEGAEGQFIRVHRSYIVPFHRIDGVRNRIISLGGEEIPIGASYETEFFKRFS
ncbi:LytR/AlgR family response regulator transcription factor [Arsenicibacter rosenii]|uniref:DNA-binding response regulator n=1 Tax=Arsenicibacter rosenii TaxID=1750698 RepID=A0A1S2VDX7_9BACT|nr:LytTR family DNA-binding domain-containing protein [Arsenicibacter rosenii]OIN56919.1 DNA-binding response regulator [Arsenicibacter rosenii]